MSSFSGGLRSEVLSLSRTLAEVVGSLDTQLECLDPEISERDMISLFYDIQAIHKVTDEIANYVSGCAGFKYQIGSRVKHKYGASKGKVVANIVNRHGKFVVRLTGTIGEELLTNWSITLNQQSDAEAKWKAALFNIGALADSIKWLVTLQVREKKSTWEYPGLTQEQTQEFCAAMDELEQRLNLLRNNVLDLAKYKYDIGTKVSPRWGWSGEGEITDREVSEVGSHLYYVRWPSRSGTYETEADIDFLTKRRAL